MNSRGQSSLELLFVTMAVISATVYFGSLFFTQSDSTRALVTLQHRLAEGFNTLDTPHIVEQIEFQAPSPDQIQFTVRTKPALDQTAIQSILTEIENEIEATTPYTTAEITLNPSP